MEAVTTSGTPEHRRARELDVERCIRLLLGMTGALNQWTDLFKSVTPSGDENWQQLRQNRTKIVNYLDAIKVAAVACSGAADEIASDSGADVQLQLVRCIRLAGQIGDKIAKHALKPLEWSSGWASWQKVSMMAEIDDCKVACRDGLRLAYQTTGRGWECVGRDMLFAEPLNNAREMLFKIASDLRSKMSYKKIAEHLRANHADLIAEAAPNEKGNDLYPSESTVRRWLIHEIEFDGL